MTSSRTRRVLTASFLGALLVATSCAGAGQSDRSASSAPAPTPTPIPHDARADVCTFAGERFDDGIITTEDGTSVYMAVAGATGGVAAQLDDAKGVVTADTLCVDVVSDSAKISCGTYYTDDTYVPIEVQQSGLRVTSSWHDDDASAAVAQVSNVYYSECSDEIAYTTYGSSALGSSLDAATNQRSKLNFEYLTTVATSMEGWAVLHGDAEPLSAPDCSALAGVERIAQAHRALERQVASLSDFDPVPAGMSDQVLEYQELISAAWDETGDESVVFDPLLALWLAAYFEWPIISDEVDLSDPDATEEDLALAAMGAKTRHGLIQTNETGFSHQAETLRMLTEANNTRCNV